MSIIKKKISAFKCHINGAGIQYRWMRENLAVKNYDEMNALANTVAVGSEGLRVFLLAMEKNAFQ